MLKSDRIDYSKDINFVSAEMALSNLNCLFRVEKSILNSILYPIYNLIVNVQDNSSKGGKFGKAHDEMAELIDHFWSKMELIEVKYESNIHLRKLLEKSQEFIWDGEFRSYLISLLRIPEFYYLSHERLSEIQSNPLDYLDEISMLNNKKSIFKLPGKDLSLQNIINQNSEFIKNHCGSYIPDLGNQFIDYLNNNKFDNKEVAFYMKRWKHNIREELGKVSSRDKIVFCHKISSSFFRNSKSIIEDNFYCYDSNILHPDIETLFHPYPRIPIEGNYDYLRLAFGLGPDFKLRNVVFTNATLQNIGSIIRDSAKKTFLEQDKMYPSPVRTDSQLDRFHNYLKDVSDKDYKICFDLSKYSDYLLSQMVEELIKYLIDDPDYAQSLINIQNLPIKIGEIRLEIMFGTGAGVKSNFDFITALNMLMIDFTSYRCNQRTKELEVVGDDLFATSKEKSFSDNLIVTYSHFNCKVNLKKAKVVKDFGKISFCNRHFWINYNEVLHWNGLPPGLWMKEIYSMNRIHAIARILIETNQHYDLDRMRDLFALNERRIEREFKINHLSSDPNDILSRMMDIPYDINGLNPETNFNYDEVIGWVKDAYSTLDNYIFMMKSNNKVKELFSTYYDIFPDHPIIQTFLFTNGKYLDIISNISRSYNTFEAFQDKESYKEFKKWIKRAISEFGKFDRGTQRVSTKDRTSDYFNEDLFWKDPVSKSIGTPYRMTDLEMEVIDEFKSDSPVAEMYMILQSNGYIRDSYRWFIKNEGIYMNLDNGIIARFVTKDKKRYNGNYYDADLVYGLVYDKLYPENNTEDKDKAKYILELMVFMNKLYRKGRDRVEEMMGFFES